MPILLITIIVITYLVASTSHMDIPSGQLAIYTGQLIVMIMIYYRWSMSTKKNIDIIDSEIMIAKINDFKSKAKPWVEGDDFWGQWRSWNGNITNLYTNALVGSAIGEKVQKAVHKWDCPCSPNRRPRGHKTCPPNVPSRMPHTAEGVQQYFDGVLDAVNAAHEILLLVNNNSLYNKIAKMVSYSPRSDTPQEPSSQPQA